MKIHHMTSHIINKHLIYSYSVHTRLCKYTHTQLTLDIIAF